MGIYTEFKHRRQILSLVPSLKKLLFSGQYNIFETPIAAVTDSHKSHRSHFRSII